MSRLQVNVDTLSEAARMSLKWQLETALKRAKQLKCSENVQRRIIRAIHLLKTARPGDGVTVRIERGMPRAPRPRSTGNPWMEEERRRETSSARAFPKADSSAAAGFFAK